jgi:hypothetical protein
MTGESWGGGISYEVGNSDKLGEFRTKLVTVISWGEFRTKLVTMISWGDFVRSW